MKEMLDLPAGQIIVQCTRNNENNFQSKSRFQQLIQCALVIMVVHQINMMERCASFPSP